MRIIVSFTLLMVGCAAVGVMSTSDPNEKLNDSFNLLQQGRALRAEQIAIEALDIYKKENNLPGQARAHNVLGEINRDGKSPEHPNLAKAKAEFIEAANLYKAVGDKKMEAYTWYAVAGTESLDGQKKAACITLKKSQQIYSTAKDYSELTAAFEKAGAFSYRMYPELNQAFGCKQ